MKKSVKRICAVFMAVIVLFGTTGVFFDVSANEPAQIDLTDILLVQTDESLQRYKVVFSDAISSGTFGVWTSMVVDGTTEVTAGQQGVCAYNHGDNKLTLYINYSAVQAGATSSSQIMEHIVTLKSGTVLGTNVLASDVSLKIDGESVMLHSSKTEFDLTGIQLAEVDADGLPRYKVVFADPIGAFNGVWTSMIVDGTTEVTASQQKVCAYNWGDNVLTMYINYDGIQAGATSYLDITEHIITLKAGTEFGNNVLATDVNLKVEGNNISFYIPKTEFDLTEIQLTEVDADGLPRYKVVFADPIGAFDGVWTSMTVDGTTEVTASQQKVCAYNWGDNVLTMYINYDGIQAGATSYLDITEHIITLKAGTEFGKNVLKNDVVLKVKGNSMSIVQEDNYNDITLDALRPESEGGAGGPQNDEKRYMIVFDNATDVGATWVPGYVDGSETSVENAACIMVLGGRVTMLLQYDKVQQGATVVSEITEHSITFKAGTLLGNNYRLAQDLTIYVDGENFSLTDDFQEPEIQYNDITLDALRPFTQGGSGGPQDDEKRYLIIFDKDEDIGATWIPGYVDGADTSVDNAACIMLLGDKVTMLLQYDKIQAGATHASEITEHSVTFKAGTLLGNNYRLAKDLTIYVKGQNFSLADDLQEPEIQYNNISLNSLRPESEGGAGGPQDDEKRYLIVFNEDKDVGATWVPGYVDGSETSVENAACIMMLGGKVTMLLQYDKVQAGATKATQITEHSITFKAGTLLGNNYKLERDLTIYVNGTVFSLTKDSQGAGGSQSGGQYKDITLDALRPATEGGAGGPQDGEKRYLVIFNETTDVGAAWITGYVDGSTTGTDSIACVLMVGGKVTMLLQYDKVQAGATVASEIKEHTVTFKAGTLLGNNYKLAKDLTIYVSGQNFALSKDTLGVGGGQGGAGVTYGNVDIKKPRPDAGDDHKYEFKVTYDSLAISNEVYSNSEEIHLEYTVKEVYNASAGKIGQIGAGTTKTPENRFPYDTAGGFMYYQNVQLTPKDEGHFLVPGATYHIVFKRQSEDIEIIATYTINGQQRIINIPNMAGQYDAKAGYIFVYSVGNVEAYLTNVKCYDAEGNSLGIQVNEPDIELIHHGGIFDYSDCIGSYYCKENNTVFKLNSDNTFTRQTGTEAAISGKYTIYDTYSMVTEEGGKEVTYEYYYNHFIDSEGNRYVHMTEYKVEFVLDDETIETYMLTDETGYFIEEPETPKKSGYTFEGWYLGDGTKYDFTQIVSESLTLYGRWKEGKAVEYKSVSADSGIGKILIPMLAVTVCSALVATTVVVSLKIWKRGKRESEQ